MLEDKKIRCEHKVLLAGKLKSTDLEMKKTSDGSECIVGKITIATDIDHSYSARVFIGKTKFGGGENKSFSSALELLTSHSPNSMKLLLETNPTMVAAQAYENAVKVYGFGMFEDWETEQGELRTSIKLSKIGISTSAKFQPQAQFEVDAYIESKVKLLNEEGEEDGIKIIGIIPTGGAQNPSAVKVPFISREPAIVSHIEDNWEAGQTVHISGDLDNVIIKQTVAAPTGFGRPRAENITTKFIDERVIKGGSNTGYEEDSDLYLSKEEIKSRLTNRQAALDRQRQARQGVAVQQTGDWGFQTAPAAAPTNTGFTF